MSAGRDALRATEVWRRHRPTGRDMSGQRFWTNLTFEMAAFLSGAVFLLLQLFLEPSFWWSWPPWSVSRELLGKLALGLLVLAPVTGGLMERYISHRMPSRMALRPVARLALCLLGSIPLAGLFLIPLARRWMEGASFRIWRPVAAGLDLDAPPASLPHSSLRHWTFLSGAFGVLLVLNAVVLPSAACFWLVTGGERNVILATCVALHLGQAGSLAFYAKSDLRDTLQSRRFLRLAAWLCLLPQPVPFLAMVPVFSAGADAQHHRTLTWNAYAQVGSVRRHSRWLDLRLALQHQWQAGSWTERWTRPKGQELPQRHGKVEAARRTWMRAKALLLPVEASLAIGWLAALTGAGPDPSYDPIRDLALRPWLLAISLTATAGLVQAAAGLLARSLRLRPPTALGPPAVGLYVFITQTALAFGLLAGPLAAHGKYRELALLAVLAGTLATLFAFLLTAFSEVLSLRTASLIEITTWPLSLLLVGLLPLPLALSPTQATNIISALTLATLLGGVVICWRFLPWILHPFTLRHLFDRRLMPGSRAPLFFSFLIAVLPLGGLVLPIWIWRRYE